MIVIPTTTTGSSAPGPLGLKVLRNMRDSRVSTFSWAVFVALADHLHTQNQQRRSHSAVDCQWLKVIRDGAIQRIKAIMAQIRINLADDTSDKSQRRHNTAVCLDSIMLPQQLLEQHPPPRSKISRRNIVAVMRPTEKKGCDFYCRG